MNNSPSTKRGAKQDYSLTDIINTLTFLRNDIQAINTKLLTQENTSSAILARMDTLSTEIIALKKENEVLKKDIDNLENNSNNPTQSLNSICDISGLDLVDEIQARENKSCNIMIFNMDESNSDVEELAIDLVKKLNIEVNISSAVRLGKKSSKPRPIRITFDSPRAVISVPKSKKSLSNVLRWKNTWITTDLTIHQRKFLSSLKKERDQRNRLDNGTWFIKYIRGSPCSKKLNYGSSKAKTNFYCNNVNF